MAATFRLLCGFFLVIAILAVTVTACEDEEVFQVPSISAFSPVKGEVGDTVFIEGENLSEVVQVRFNGVDATIISRSSGSIETVVPSGATSGLITLKAPGARINSITAFQVLPPKPIILSIQPAQAIAGDTVIITGENLAQITQVSFGETVAVIQSKSAEQLIIIVPEGATTGKITIKTEHATVTTTNDFEILIPDPKIISVEPQQAMVGDTVTLIGQHLSPVTEVSFNGVSATIHKQSPVAVVTTVPQSASTGKITIKTPEVEITTEENFVVIPPAPIISSVQPNQGIVGDTIKLVGNHFSEVTEVSFNGVVGVIHQKSNNEILAIVPAEATNGKIAIKTPYATATSASDFQVIPVPVIVEISPMAAAVGDTVRITGEELSGVTQIKFNNEVASIFHKLPELIITTVPANASTGKISLQFAGGVVMSATDFEIIPLPVISSITPNQGEAGTPVTIEGENLSAVLEVRFNGELAEIQSKTATSIVVSVPVNATTGKITLTSSFTTLASENDFVVIPPQPTISSFDPITGLHGQAVTITGSNFDNLIKVSFDGVDAVVDSYTFTTIETSVPANATTGKIRVETENGTIESSIDFTVLLPQPLIESFEPTIGLEGDTILITGVNFENLNTVLFNGVPGVVNSSTPTNVSVIVPADAATGKISVTTTNGTVESTSNFEIEPFGISVMVGSTKRELNENTVITMSGNSPDRVARVMSQTTTDEAILFEFERFGLLENRMSMDFTTPASGSPTSPAISSLYYERNGMLWVNGIVVFWNSDSDKAIDYFDLEWSDDNLNFQLVESVQATKTAPESRFYVRSINESVKTNGFVRIKVVYLDGEVEYTGSLTVTLTYPVYVCGIWHNQPVNHSNGHIEITRYDTTRRIISGTFRMTASGYWNVTSGRFAIKY